MSNKQQTAVEWLIERFFASNEPFDYKHLEQAKKMEKQQIIEAYKYGNQSDVYFKPEQYYNETYKTKNP